MTEAGVGEPDATKHHAAPEKLLLLTGPKTKDRTTYRLKDGTEVRVAETHNVPDSTGFIVWDAAWCLARHLEKRAAHFAELVGTGTVAELGSGTGLSGLAAARVLPSAKVVLTDLGALLDRLARNVSLNPSVQHRVSSQELDWNWAPNAIREAACGLGPVRLVLASDCVWLADQVDAFVSVACALCPDTQRLLICQQRRSRMLEEALWGALEAAGFEDAAPKWSSEDGLIAIRELRRRAVYEGSRALCEK